MSLDPIFSNVTLSSLSIPTFQRDAAWAREEIASLEDDIRCLERDIHDIDVEIPRMEIERLTKQRDLAEMKLAVYEKRAKLNAKLGGAA